MGQIILLTFIAMLQFVPAMPTDAMGPKIGGGDAPPTSKRVNGKQIAIGMILKAPEDFENKEVVLEGAFRGWNGKCEESSPLTRSDWILEDATGCIYVSGEIPSWVSTTAPKGESLVVLGEIKTKGSRKPYLRTKEVTRKSGR